MKGRKILGHLFDYTLATHFVGNKTNFAKGLGLPKSEIYRMRRLLTKGGISGVAAERLLAFYWRKRLSLDEVVHNFKAPTIIPPRMDDHEFVALMDAGEPKGIAECREYMREFGRENDSEHRIMSLAYSLTLMIERHFCGGNVCKAMDCEHYLAIDGHEFCPSSLLVQFVDHLRKRYLCSVSVQ